MAEDFEDKTTGIDIVRTSIWSAAGLVLAWVGITTAEVMRELTNEVGGLRVAIVRLEGRVDRLPPPEMMYRIEAAEQELKRIQVQIDRIESVLPEVRGKALGKYN